MKDMVVEPRTSTRSNDRSAERLAAPKPQDYGEQWVDSRRRSDLRGSSTAQPKASPIRWSKPSTARQGRMRAREDVVSARRADASKKSRCRGQGQRRVFKMTHGRSGCTATIGCSISAAEENIVGRAVGMRRASDAVVEIQSSTTLAGDDAESRRVVDERFGRATPVGAVVIRVRSAVMRGGGKTKQFARASSRTDRAAHRHPAMGDSPVCCGLRFARDPVLLLEHKQLYADLQQGQYPAKSNDPVGKAGAA